MKIVAMLHPGSSCRACEAAFENEVLANPVLAVYLKAIAV
jgi:hypothetical protein